MSTDTRGIDRPITIAIMAMGGQGGGVLADWIVDLAEHGGWVAQTTSVPGVAQRTGATIYYVELIRPQQRNSRPVLSLMPVPGDVDIVIAAELMEAGRAIQRGLVSPDKTTLIASSHRSLAVLEKATPGDGRADSAAVLETATTAARRFLHADMQSMAEAQGSVISAALFGALAGSAAEYLQRPYDHLLFSFHGVPERHLRKSDPTGRHCLSGPNCCTTPSPAHATCYRAQCFRTVAAFVKQAGVPEGKYSIAFQSRLGRDPWLKPYADQELARLAERGVKKLLVICPAFVSDCLETIEEIGMRGRETFLEAGGTDFALIPCLNEHPLWLEALEKMVGRFTAAA